MAKTKDGTVEKKPKSNIYMSASMILDHPKQIVPVSPAMDVALGGGVSESVLMTISGPEKLGKTSLALKIASNAQKMGKMVIFADVEHRLKIMNLKGIKGLLTDDDHFKVIRSVKGDILSGETILERCEESLLQYPGSILIVDSLSALCPAAEQTKLYSESIMAARGKLEATFCRRIAPIISVNDNIVIGIAHIAANIGGYGMSEKMGQTTRYALDYKVKCTKSQPFEWTSGDQQVGQRIKFECLTSALDKPGGEAVCWLRYGEGFSDEMEIIEMAVELQIIDKGGSWFTLTSGEKIQGQDQLYQMLVENPSLYDDIYKKVKEVLQ